MNGSESSQLTLMKMYNLLYDERLLNLSTSKWDEIHWSNPFLESQTTLISISKTVRGGNNVVSSLVFSFSGIFYEDFCLFKRYSKILI